MNMLSTAEAATVIKNSRLGHLGCIAESEPYVLPINYLFEDDTLYCHSSMGLKITAMRRNPNVCLQVEEIKSDFQWRSAIAFGTFEEITDKTKQTAVLKKLLAHFPLLTPVEAIINGGGSPPEVIVFRIKVSRITGVSEA